MADSHSHSSDHSSDHHADDGNVHVHVHPVKFYVTILLTLMVLTALTLGVGEVHLGAANLVVAVIIATIKAALVVLFFMHLKEDRKFNALLFVGSLLFGGIFLAYTMNDTAYRHELDSYQGNYVDPITGAVAPARKSPPTQILKLEKHGPGGAHPAHAAPGAGTHPVAAPAREEHR